MKKSVVVSMLILALVAGSLASCSAKGLKIAGSTTVLPLSQVWAEAYMRKNPSVSISVSGGGSGTGLSMLLNGACDIANASRPAKSKEIDTARGRNSQLVATKLAKDGITIIVNAANTRVKNMTMAQLAAVYSGRVDNWRALGGENKGIVVVGRDSSSGTYGSFQDMVLGGGAYRKDMLSQASNAAVAQAVAQSSEAIGYVGLAYAKEYVEKGKVRIISISRKHGEPGIEPSDRTISNETYPLFRYLYAYTLGAPRGAAGAFLRWCTGPQGQSMVKESGYLPLR